MNQRTFNTWRNSELEYARLHGTDVLQPISFSCSSGFYPKLQQWVRTVLLYQLLSNLRNTVNVLRIQVYLFFLILQFCALKPSVHILALQVVQFEKIKWQFLARFTVTNKLTFSSQNCITRHKSFCWQTLDTAALMVYTILVPEQ